MVRRAIWALLLVVSLVAPIAAHAQGEYLDRIHR